MIRRRAFLLGLMLGWAVSASVGAAVAADFSPALQAVIAAAKKDPTLTISYGNDTLGGAEGAKLFQAGMNKLFGTNVDVRYAPGAAMAQLGNQLITEINTHQPASTDVYVAAATQEATMVEHKALMEVDWKALMPDRINDAAIEENGMAVRIGGGMSGATYNTKLAPFVPERLTDFLDPRWKGKIATTAYGAGFDGLTANGVWGPDKMLDYIGKFSGQVGGFIRCGELERIAAGQFAVLAMDCIGGQLDSWQAKGAPMGRMIPLDGAQVRYYYTSIPKNSANVAAAKLYVAFIQTAEGQAILRKVWAMDSDAYPDSDLGKLVDAIHAKGATTSRASIAWWMEHPEINTTTDQLVTILRKQK